LVAPAGAEVLGTVVEAVPLKKFGGQPKLSLQFESLEVTGGASVPVTATLVQQGKKQAGRDAAKIGGGAAAGAIGTAVAAKTGKEVEIPAGTRVVVALASAVQVRVGS
jgi:hypothetical protein